MTQRSRSPRKAIDSGADDTRATDRVRRLSLAALTALLVAAPFIPGAGMEREGQFTILAMLWTLLPLPWLIVGVRRGRLDVQFGPAGVALAGFVVVCLVSVVLGARLGSPRPVVNMFWVWISLAVSFWLLRCWLRTAAECRALCVVMIVLAATLSAHGVWQVRVALPAHRAAYEQNRELHLQRLGLDAREESPTRKRFEARLYTDEPLSTFALTNSLAGFLTPWLIVAVAVGLGRHGALRRRWLAVGAGAVLIGVCLLSTKSRSAYVAVAVGAALLAGYAWLARSGDEKPTKQRPRLMRRRWLLVVGVLALIAVVGGVAWATLDVQVLSEAPKSFRYRLEYWQATVAMIAERPWLGCGPGNFQDVYTAFKLPQASEEVADPHNFLLEIAATTGLLGLAGMLAALVCVVYGVVRRDNGIPGATAGQASSGTRKRPVNAPSGAAAYVLAGSAVGIAVAYPCATLIGFQPDAIVVWIWLLAAGGGYGLLWDWIQRGRLNAPVLLTAAAALLVNLLAAGGIVYPAVGGQLAILAAVALCLTDVRSHRAPIVLRRPAIVALLTLAAVAALTCHRTSYRPVLYARADQRVADAHLAAGNWNLPEVETLLLAAAEADRRWGEPRSALAEIHLRRWLIDRSDAQWRRFTEYRNQAVALRPAFFGSYVQSGDWHLRAYHAGGDRRHVSQAVADYRRAVALYPNNAVGRVQLAWAHHLAGDATAAARQAEAALKLDAQMPHAERKLAQQKLRVPAVPDDDAEQTARRLRNRGG